MPGVRLQSMCASDRFVLNRRRTMKVFEAVLLAAMFAFGSLVAPVSWAQGHADHIMVAPKDLKSAGSVAIMQPKTNHFAWTKTATIVQLHGMGPWGVTYVNPADDPRKK
jgi:alcohol dehydrogenase YqhD (iron-dependent ADH family)